MIQKQKHKQSYQLKFLSLYNSPLSLLPLNLSNKILLDEVLFNFINSNTILSSLFIQSTIENNIFQIYLTKSTVLKNRKKFKNRRKDMKKVSIPQNTILNSKELINILNRSFTYINNKKPIFDLYSVKSIILEPSLLANWIQFQLLKNRIKILLLMKKVTKTFILVLKTKNKALKKKILSFNIRLKTILLIIIVLIIIRTKKWAINNDTHWSNREIQYRYSTLNFQEINNKLIKFFKTKKPLKKIKRKAKKKKVVNWNNHKQRPNISLFISTRMLEYKKDLFSKMSSKSLYNNRLDSS